MNLSQYKIDTGHENININLNSKTLWERERERIKNIRTERFKVQKDKNQAQ